MASGLVYAAIIQRAGRIEARPVLLVGCTINTDGFDFR